jgi:hypothetical protein
MLTACGVNITDRTPSLTPVPQSQQRPSSISPAPNTQAAHDLSVAAIDFDPALDPQQFVLGKPYSLLVAVENRGNRRDGPITVTAQLLTYDRKQVLITQQRTVSYLAPGEVTVVRFPSSTLPPRQRAYLLNVQIDPLAGEANTANNRRTLEIQVNSGY